MASCETEERGDATVVQFRPDGALTLRRQHNPDGSEWSSVYEYNDADRLVSVRTENAARLVDGQRYEYDADGRLLRVVSWAGDGSERIAESYEYSATGQRTKIIHVDVTNQNPDTMYLWGVDGTDCFYSAPGAATLLIVHNARDQPTELLFHDKDGRTLSRVEFVYDETGQLAEETQTMVIDILPPEVLAEMSPADLETVRAWLESTSRRRHRYDAQGHRIETKGSTFAAHGRDSKTMTYNDFGDRIGEISEHEQQDSGMSHSDERFLYDYDTRGNWIKQVVEVRNATDEDFYVSSTEQRTLSYLPT